LPQSKSALGVADSPGTPEAIDPIVEDTELRLEVWTQGSLTRHCHGQVILEGSDLLRQCYKEEDKRAKRAVPFRLIPRKHATAGIKLLHGRSSTTDMLGSLSVILFYLKPPCQGKDQRLPKKRDLGDEKRQKRRDVKLLAKQLMRGPIEAELGGILIRIERGAADERRDGIMQLADLALSKVDDIADIFLSQGAAPVIVGLLADRSPPVDRRDGATAVRGLFSDGNGTSRRKLLAAGILPHLIRLTATTNPALGDASHEGFCALAELLDRAASSKTRPPIVTGVDGGSGTESQQSSTLLPGDGADDGNESDDDDDSSTTEEESIPSGIIDELFSTCGAAVFVQALVHGANRTKPAAASILAALAGTPKGAEGLVQNSGSGTKSGVHSHQNLANKASSGGIVKVLLDVANSGPNQTSEVKTDCLRAIFGLTGGAENPIQARCALIDRSGGRAIFGESSSSLLTTYTLVCLRRECATRSYSVSRSESMEREAQPAASFGPCKLNNQFTAR
jgi:hypothetical protein